MLISINESGIFIVNAYRNENTVYNHLLHYFLLQKSLYAWSRMSVRWVLIYGKFIFYKSGYVHGKLLMHIIYPFCAYAMFINDTPVLFLLSPGKMLLTMFRFQKWLGSSFPEDVWAWWLLMHWLQLQFTPCEALPSVWIGFAWQYSQACSHPCCLSTFSYPISSFQPTLHLICFDTALIEQPPRSVMTLCDLPCLWRVSMIIFWTIAKSAVFPIIVVLKNKRYPQFILYGWSFIEIQM